MDLNARPFGGKDLLRHHLAYDEGRAHAYFERILLLLPPDPAERIAHARRLYATAMSGNAASAARLLLALPGGAPPDLLEEGLAAEDALLRLEIIFALRKMGRRFFDPEIEEYILLHDRTDERLRMAERYARETASGDRLYRALLSATPPEGLSSLAESMALAARRALCPDLRAAVAACGLKPTVALLLSGASLGCPAARDGLAAAARAAARDDAAAGASFLAALVRHLRRAGAARTPPEVVEAAIRPFLPPRDEGELLHPLLCVAALHPEGAAAALPDLSGSPVPDLAFLARLARRKGAFDAGELPQMTAPCREVALDALGRAAVGDPAVAAELLEVERARPETFDRVAEHACAVHVGRAAEALLACAGRLLAPDARPAPGLESSAALAALLLSAGRLDFGHVRRALAACGGAGEERSGAL